MPCAYAAAAGSVPVSPRSTQACATFMQEPPPTSATATRACLDLRGPLPRTGEDAELLQQAQHVDFDPLFHELPLHNPIDLLPPFQGCLLENGFVSATRNFL